MIDPTDSSHIFVGSAQGVRGLSHVIGNGGQVRLEPDANQPGLYESTDGGATFTEVWNGNDNASFGVTDVASTRWTPTRSTRRPSTPGSGGATAGRPRPPSTGSLRLGSLPASGAIA